MNAANISWRFGGWEYGGLGTVDVWPGGAVECAHLCEDDIRCMHWDYHCMDLHCYHYGEGGYEDDGDPQFGRDFWFLGDSSRYNRTR